MRSMFLQHALIYLKYYTEQVEALNKIVLDYVFHKFVVKQKDILNIKMMLAHYLFLLQRGVKVDSKNILQLKKF